MESHLHLLILEQEQNLLSWSTGGIFDLINFLHLKKEAGVDLVKVLTS